MTERDRLVYCTQCGSIVQPGDNFCGVCGSAIPPDAPLAGPMEEIPTQVHAPPDVPTRRSNLPLLIGLGVAIALVFVLGLGTVAALTLLRGEPENQGGAAPSPATTQQEDIAGDRKRLRRPALNRRKTRVLAGTIQPRTARMSAEESLHPKTPDPLPAT